MYFGERGNSIKIINRTAEKAKRLAEEIVEKTGNKKVSGAGFESGWNDLKDAGIVIQTTELGMGKYIDVSVFDELPLPAGKTKDEMIRNCIKNQTVFDIVYNPEETKFLKEANAAGAKTMNGVMMLVYQGALAFQIWTGKMPDTKVMKKAVTDALKKDVLNKNEQKQR